MMRRFSICVAVVAVLSALSVDARAGQTLSLSAGFSPVRLGQPTNLSAKATFSSDEPGPLSPVTRVRAYGPAGMTIDTKGAGVCRITTEQLQARGPKACPANSRIGFGKATGLFALAGEDIQGPFTLDFFLASRSRGHLRMLIYVSAVSPASEQLALTATEIHGTSPYGFGIQFDVPVISALPQAPPGWVRTVTLTFGSTHIAYYTTLRGRRMLRHVRGIVVPRRCPAGGFAIEGQVDLADGTQALGRTTIPCPGRSR